MIGMSPAEPPRASAGFQPHAALLIAGLIFMAMGAAFGDFQAILANARLICLSCIGIQ